MKIHINYILFGLLLSTFISASNISEVQSWGYQLQNFNLEELKNSDFDLLVIDYSKDGTDETRFTKPEILEISSGKAGRLVISYISIGEAEDYRYYFDDNWLSNPPEWFDGENLDWGGNYKVKYWFNEWQQIIFDYLDKIIASGFDGVYLDIIDGYEFYEEAIPDAADKMIDFVVKIANYTRNKDSDFIIIPQNGEGLLEFEHYRQIIDGIAREEVYVIATDDKRDIDETKKIEMKLDLLTAINKTVFVVEYASKLDLINYSKNSAKSKGYISFVTVVKLDQLGIKITNTETDGVGAIYSLWTILIIPVIISKIRKFKSKVS